MIKYIPEECPRYSECSVNNCPLHIDYPGLYVDKEDKEKVCDMEKQVRIRISSKYPDVLKYQGLTVREWTAKKRYESLPEEEKASIAERGKKALLDIKNKEI